MPLSETPDASRLPARPGRVLDRRDALWCLPLVVLASWLTLDSVVLPPTLQMDNLIYLTLAADPEAYFRVSDVHAQRILPPLLVWLLGKAGLDPIAGFQLLSAASLQIFLPLFFLTLRGARVGRPVAFGTTVFLTISAWPVPYSLSNVYQACDAMAYPLGLLIIVGTVTRRPGVAVTAALSGALVRQQLVVLGAAALIQGYRATGHRRWLVGLGALVVLFGAVVGTAGGGGMEGLWSLTGARALAVESLARGFVETRLPVLLSPFLLLLAMDVRAVGRWAVRYWWITAFVVATVVQPLLAFPMIGPSNAVRLAMMGIWPLFLLAGIRLEERWLPTRWSRWVYVGLPLLYGTEHLVSLQTTWPSPVGHRAVVNVLLIGLAMAAVRVAGRTRVRPEGTTRATS